MFSHKFRFGYRCTLLAALCAAIPGAANAQTDEELLEAAEVAFDEGGYSEAAEIWTPLADRGNIDAQLRLADETLICDCVDDSTNIAFKYYRMAAQQGNTEGLRGMGWIYKVKGDDPVEAAVYYKQAADLGSPLAQIELGDLYRDGVGGSETLAQMPKYYLMAAAQGDRDGYARMARLYTAGGPIKADPVKAYTAQSIAAAMSFPMAKEKAAEAAKKLSAKQLVKANILVAKCVKAKFLKCL
jgi:uncharacterized protein